MENQVKEMPRGIRNNNPLNIVHAKHNKWIGECPVVKIVEPRFCRFESMKWGFRAAAITLRSYINKYKRNTIEKIICAWAPTNENNTEAYINAVCDKTEMKRNEPLLFENQIAMLKIISAMCCVENGNDWDPQKDQFLWKDMYEGYMMARH